MIDVPRPKPLTVTLTSTTCTCRLIVSAYSEKGVLHGLQISIDYCMEHRVGKKPMPEVRSAIRLINAWQTLAQALTNNKKSGLARVREVLYDTTGFEFIEDSQTERAEKA